MRIEVVPFESIAKLLERSEQLHKRWDMQVTHMNSLLAFMFDKFEGRDRPVKREDGAISSSSFAKLV